MLVARAGPARSLRCSLYTTTTTRGLRTVPTLPDASLETFRREALSPETPALLPRGTFNHFPAVSKWFTPPSASHPLTLNQAYLTRYGPTLVPLEITHDGQFARLEHSLSFFLECVLANASTFRTWPSRRYFSAFVPGARGIRRTTVSNHFFSASAVTAPTARVYLAQAALADLPQGLRADVPTPGLVLEAGKGDVYASSIWLGVAPTYTPLHRDPNPNLFVQLAGRKRVRLFSPGAGRNVFAKVQDDIGGGGSANLRGVEMMEGRERAALEEEVWGRDDLYRNSAFEAELGGGDGLFIPKGWWHSFKGTGEGMTGSVNWWFR
ncbi:hypothetical protein LTR08_004089 [Meristemomyces frigidus]|nr:hypothetical protein LTR08_004089 [Meristemomyces frigidus]